MAVRQIKMIGARLRYYDTRMKEGIVFHRLHLTAVLTKVLADKMGWVDAIYPDSDVPKNGWESMKLDGALTLKGMRIEADGLKQTLEISATNVGDFQAKREGGEILVDFLVRTEDRAHQIEEFWREVGEASSALVLQGAAEQKTIEDEVSDRAAAEEKIRGPLATVKGGKAN